MIIDAISLYDSLTSYFPNFSNRKIRGIIADMIDFLSKFKFLHMCCSECYIDCLIVSVCLALFNSIWLSLLRHAFMAVT